MAISKEEFVNVLRHYPSGVTVVTVKAREETHGLTVAAFASVSPEPPRILVVVDHRGYGYQLLERDDAVFAVNFLREDQKEVSDRFAFKEDRFAQGNWSTAATGAPVFEDAVAWLDCTIHGRFDAGTNTIYVGEIQAAKVITEDQPPLLYWNRGYRGITDISSED